MATLFDLFIDSIETMRSAMNDGWDLGTLFAEVGRGEYDNFLQWAAGMLEAIRVMEAVLVFMLQFVDVIGPA